MAQRLWIVKMVFFLDIVLYAILDPSPFIDITSGLVESWQRYMP